MSREAAILAIGDELLAGAHPDLNSPFIAARLEELGWRTRRVAVVGDDEEPLAALLEELLESHDLVVTSGGLGPTLDDVTRHAAARAAGVELELVPEALETLRTWWLSRGAEEMPKANERQALIPRGAELLENACGTAPGFRLEHREAQLFVLPGPPYELQAMFRAEVLPRLAASSDGGSLALGRFYLFGLSESVFAERVGAWMQRDSNPLMGVSAKGGVLHVSLRARGENAELARALLVERSAAFREEFGEHLFSEETGELEAVVAERLIEGGFSLAVAESCTGGLICSRLTRIPGISAVLREGLVTYSNASKIERLGVPAELIERCGAVSPEVAQAMARGAAERSGARLAVATTGIAGPDGGSEEKPVGLVYFGLSVDGEAAATERRFPPKERAWIQSLAATTALSLLAAALPAERGDREL